MLPRELLYIADEAFFVGTAVEITPIRSVDKIPVGNGRRGPITEALQTGVLRRHQRRGARPARLADLRLPRRAAADGGRGRGGAHQGAVAPIRSRPEHPGWRRETRRPTRYVRSYQCTSTTPPDRRRQRGVGPAPQGRQLPDDARQRHARRRLGRKAARPGDTEAMAARRSSAPSSARSSARAQEVDLAYSIAGAGPLPLQRVPAARHGRPGPARDPDPDQDHRRARAAAGAQEDRLGRARPGARDRHDRQRQEHDARRDDRLHQLDPRGAHHDGRGPDRIPAPRPPLDRQPARGLGRHAVVLARAAQRAAPGPRRHPGRRDARLRDGRDGAARGRNGPPRVLDAAHARRDRDRSTASSPSFRRTSSARSASSSRASSRRRSRSACCRAPTARAASRRSKS